MNPLSLLRPYQLDAARQLASREKVGLWMAAGTGKTATVLAALYLVGLPRPYLVVTRALGRGVWARDAAWLLGDYHVPATLIGGTKMGDGQHGENVYSDLELALRHYNGVVISYDVLRGRIQELCSHYWPVVIFDESHMVKGGHLPKQRKRDGTIHQTRFMFAQRLAKQAHSSGGYVWEMTATPIKDRPRDLWGQLELVLPGQFGTAWQFLHYFCAASYGEYGLVTDGLSNAEELRARLDRHFVRVTREQIADQLPLMTRSIVEVEKDEGAVEKWGGGLEDALARSAQMKYSSAVELAADYLNTDCKVVMVVNRRRLVPQLYQRFERMRSKVLIRKAREGCPILAVTGDMEAMRRARELDAFNEAKGPRALIATIDSLSESINLHKCDACIVLSLPYTHGILQQLEGRFSRLGGISSEIKYLVVRDTIDERVKALLLDKQEKIIETCTSTTDTAAAKEAFEMRERDDELLASLRSWLDKEG